MLAAARDIELEGAAPAGIVAIELVVEVDALAAVARRDTAVPDVAAGLEVEPSGRSVVVEVVF
jgi:hypothetical protein